MMWCDVCSTAVSCWSVALMIYRYYRYGDSFVFGMWLCNRLRCRWFQRHTDTGITYSTCFKPHTHRYGDSFVFGMWLCNRLRCRWFQRHTDTGITYSTCFKPRHCWFYFRAKRHGWNEVYSPRLATLHQQWKLSLAEMLMGCVLNIPSSGESKSLWSVSLCRKLCCVSTRGRWTVWWSRRHWAFGGHTYRMQDHRSRFQGNVQS